MLSLYRGLSRSVSNWNDDEWQDDQRRPSRLDQDPEEIWHKQIESQILSLSKSLEHSTETVDPQIIQEFQSQINTLQETLIHADQDIAAWVRLGEMVSDVDLRMREAGLRSADQLSPQSSQFHLAPMRFVVPPSESGCMSPTPPSPITSRTQLKHYLTALQDGSLDSVEVASALLAAIQDSPDNIITLAAHGPLPALLTPIQPPANPSSQLVTPLLAVVTLTVSNSPALLDELVQVHRGVDFAFTVLRNRMRDTPVLCGVLQLVTALAANTSARSELRSRQDINLLVVAMERHPEDSGVQTAGCLCIGTLSSVDRHLRIKLGDSKGAHAVQQALKNFMSDDTIALSALLALVNLATRDQICLDLARDRVDQHVLEALELHVGSADIAGSALWFLAHMGASDAGLDNLDAMRVFDSCQSAILAHPSSAEVQRRGCWVMSILARKPEALKLFGPALAEAVVGAMENANDQDTELKNYGDLCLLELMRSDCVLPASLKNRIRGLLETKRKKDKN
eukprot:c25552_g1_i1.p1 GENE.c25552_g1_i1~~c25552_g1_i1.p1  ORF type:complete len:511 (-),score=120.62 c25552_g1_i1:74-1606(-)